MIELILNKKKYQEKTVLFDTELKLPSCGLYVLTGENMSGKSTLLHILGLIDTDYEGSYSIDNDCFQLKEPKDIDEYRCENISMIMPKNNLLTSLSVKENAVLLLKDRYLECGFSEKLLRKKASVLSGGENMIVCLQIELKLNRKIVLLDEVTSELDDNNCKKTMELVSKLAENRLVVFATHDSRIEKTNHLAIIGGKINVLY